MSRLSHSDFPKEKQEGYGDFYCGGCKEVIPVWTCKECGRQGRKWCEEHQEYHSNNYFYNKCEFSERKLWNEEDFPEEKVSEFYCADCEEGSIKREHSCGRRCWKWCGECEGYRSNHHYKKCGRIIIIRRRKKPNNRIERSESESEESSNEDDTEEEEEEEIKQEIKKENNIIIPPPPQRRREETDEQKLERYNKLIPRVENWISKTKKKVKKNEKKLKKLKNKTKELERRITGKKRKRRKEENDDESEKENKKRKLD